MRTELLLVIIILSVITVSSLFLSIWNVFVTKKQTTFSATDFLFGLGLGIIVGATNLYYVSSNNYLYYMAYSNRYKMPGKSEKK